MRSRSQVGRARDRRRPDPLGHGGGRDCLGGRQGGDRRLRHRRSREAFERGAGAARARTVALPFGIFRQAARDPWQPPGYPGGRRSSYSNPSSFLTAAPRCWPGRPPELDQLATALLDLDTRIPSKLNWVCASMAIATRPIAVSSFKANWELSAARAISVVQYLISKGVSPRRLVAAGFGEFQPIDPSAIF